ncbi:MAG TPA: polysaccharide biosynthesis/export family protein [Cyclobacteriaceae bacterium]|nr:polysaccharide biosynthesis/export family protein [Cyclobacteriaceae bacterium]HMV09770.1 polysaccharide biosynthesis/export family protein [Cyclobacteriaceae bacterium]HMV88783.1 polysaccharide biosynthesis/export family protein [Cyclobacteriaceae bacterium]HMX02323.1 polysaccharide biosynthesis/export family protein [Cyclobacteriaceae bacterium]HMX52215.1 polysaccharide biosynthesis/export family protein [Cyclobacteriaceae bacterium]
MRGCPTRLLILFFVALMAASCGSYKQNIMFKVPDQAAMQQQAEEAQRNYVIQVNDYLKLAVYTNKGERIIDPDLELLKQVPVQAGNLRPDPSYLVDVNGVVKFPMIGEIKLVGLTIRQAEKIIQEKYADSSYKNPFVTLQYTNKRVVILGSPGGAVVPLVNENVTLAEVLAMGKGIDNFGKAHNIRVLRGETYFLVDFSTIEGYRKGNMIMQHGDIVYVEPVRRPVSEAARDYGPLLSLAVSLSTLIIVLVGL